ncbi:protein ANTI-SILENCING 1-like [Solanum lycopersicum]|uniref:protein ANTI-SILENCING 1-like n=1 Tax=Solanum lycopersicum TaxID=4081 RepID=UPI000532C255|nr:protein ANTI-SILENCING 1-like isoform X1 [Solanum lycopersicum]XP_010316963.1 protein ANTI-SILENCING 1-like isoform X1 [Solanum lycopersicum]XP_010316964.1 protein ANTI-SILENCING 1-like isoform X1 [Solanum lycopersicum]
MVPSIHDSSPAIFERLTSNCDKYQMFPRQEAVEEDSPEFSWGAKKGKGALNKDVQFYKSFTYAGVEFNLYDCVYMYRHGEEEPDIGKIVKVWETKTRKRLVKVVWFFRPTEVTHWLGNTKVLDNELLLASGEGVGLSNCNPLEAITGKCNVVCISIDRRNPQPKDRDLETAEFLFYRTFDVGTQEISEEFPSSIAQIEVEHFFNKVTDLKQPLHYGGKASLDKPHSFGGATVKTTLKDDQPGRNSQSTLPRVALVKQTKSSTKDVAMARTDKCTTISQCQVTELVERGGQGRQGNVSKTDKTVARTEVKHSYCTPSTNALKKRKLQHLSDTKAFDQHKIMKSTNQVIEVTTRAKEAASTWFNEGPWYDRLQAAQKRGTLVLLENLDPSYASTEVEDIVWHALRQKVSAKMVPHNTFSNPLNGKAFVIFKSSEAAETAIFELKRTCLMLGDGRPVVARRGTIQEPVKSKDFPGHLSIEKINFQKLGEEMRKAVSTSHYAQSNTIEHELAVEWRVLQEQSNRWWKALHQEQAAEIEQLSSKLKNPIKNSV